MRKLRDNRRVSVLREPRLVGREQELALVDAFVDAIASQARALILRGEAGIGKTSLWRYGLDRAAASEVRVCAARCAEVEILLLMAGLTDLLEEVFPELTDELPRPQRRALEVALGFAEAGEASVERLGRARSRPRRSRVRGGRTTSPLRSAIAGCSECWSSRWASSTGRARASETYRD